MKTRNAFRFYYPLAVCVACLTIVSFAFFGKVSGNFRKVSEAASGSGGQVGRETESIAFADRSGRIKFFECDVDIKSGDRVKDALAFLFRPGKRLPDGAVSYISPSCDFLGCVVENRHLYVLVTENFYSGLSDSEVNVALRQIKRTASSVMPELRRYSLILSESRTERDFGDV